MTLSLRRRILLTVTPLLVLLTALGVAGVTLLVQLGQRSAAILRENYDSVRAMDRLDEAAERIDSSFHLALAGKENEARALFRTNWSRYREQLAIEENNITILPEEPRLVAELQRLTAVYEDRGKQFFARPPGDAARKADYFETEGNAGLLLLFGEIKRVAEAIHDLNENQMQTASRQAQVTARISVVGFLIGLAVTALLALAAVWWLQWALLGPIKSVTQAAQAIGGGQLHLLVPVYGADELGQLAVAFNGMAGKLRAYRQTNTERLVRARQMGQATIDSFPDPVIVLDPLGRVESANPAAQRLLGVRPPQDSEPPQEWQPPASLSPVILDALRQQRATVCETFDEALTFRLDGDEHQFLPQVRPIQSAERETLGAAVVLNDVTRFRLLDRLKSDWVATVSHELKTPLTSVRLAVHVLLEEVVGPLEPKQIELLIEARDSTERLLKLIEHLLALAKLEDGRETLDLKATDPAGLLRAAADGVALRAEDKRIEIVLNDEPGLPAVRVDVARFGRVLNNLLDNALTYTEPGGRIVLAAERTEDARVPLSVSDTGIGIPVEYLPHVFDRFFRVPGRDQTPGTGLGLAIVREIVTAHHGEIVCASEPGKGTSFRITLPAEGEAPMTSDEVRPAPEKFLTLIRNQQRGRLKIYLGFAPGVGKTYEMLQEGQRLKRQGVDVVVGMVETHGRADTAAQIADLEQVPRRRIDYRGVTLEEMDTDAVLARRPTVALVDELAHTNAPGSRLAKRYQDVEELRRAGIHVVSTMNIQHLESLYDIIERFASVKVKERVPDHVLAGADQLVNVDVSAEDLQDRLRQGKVYPAERVERALLHFFTADNLSRLRELALEEIASALDRQRQKQGGQADNGSDRVMVCLSSRSPNVHRLLRKAARLADRFNAPWYAVYVQTPRERMEQVDAATQRQISDALTLAQQLGGISMPFTGPSFEDAVAAFVAEYRITHILMGRSMRPWYQRWFGRTALDRLVIAVPQVDITLVDVR